ncbi:hypothetical protein JCM11641_002170 [Rhodosporidiobolus odoratus]
MLRVSILSALALAAAAVDATRVLIPLYSWDEDCWPELQTAVAKNPSTSFLAIINPSSGPISDVSDPSLYCVPVLRKAIPNLTLLGYVRTGYGDRSASTVESEIGQYEGWKDLKVKAGGVEGSAELDGIFFDESLSFKEDQIGLDSYKGFSKAAREAFGEQGTIMYNPGTPSGQALYDIANVVVAYEHYYTQFAAADLPTGDKIQAQSAIMLHDFPTSSSTLSTVLSAIVPAYDSVWISDAKINKEDIYQNWGSNWNSFVANVASANSKSNSGGGVASTSQATKIVQPSSTSSTTAKSSLTSSRAVLTSTASTTAVRSTTTTRSSTTVASTKSTPSAATASASRRPWWKHGQHQH